jgi:hypothetical protein
LINKLGILLLALVSSVLLFVTVTSHGAIPSHFVVPPVADMDIEEAENVTSTGSGSNQTATSTNSTG